MSPPAHTRDDDGVEVRQILAAVLARPASRRRFIRDLAEEMRQARDRSRARERLRSLGGGGR